MGKKDAVSAHAEAEGETKSKKHKKQTAKKKKKKKKKDEKQERKSPSRSPSESSSASGSESEGEGAKTAGDGKYVPAAGSEPKEPISKLVPKGKAVEEEVAPVLMQKPEVLEVKKEETKDMDVSSFGGKTSCTDVSENMRSPSTGQNEVTQIEAVKEKAEDRHGDGTFSCAQELPDIIPKQEDLGAPLVAPDQDRQQGVQEAGALEVDLYRDAGGHHPLDPAVQGPGQSAGVGEPVHDPLLCLREAAARDPGVLANGPNPERPLLVEGLNRDRQPEGILGPLSGKRSKSRSLSRRHRSPQLSKRRSKSPRRSGRGSMSKSASALNKSKSRSRSESSDGRSDSSSSARSISNTPVKENKPSPSPAEKTAEVKAVEENGGHSVETACVAGDEKPAPPATDLSSQGGTSSEMLQDQPVEAKNWYAPRSRSASQEPGSGSDGSDGSEDKEEESPVKPVFKSQKSSSGSASPELPKKKLSKSNSPADRRKRSRSTSKPPSRRKLSRSKSPVKKKGSVSPSERKKRRSKSRSPARRRRSLSRSVARRKRSRSKSRNRNRRSKSRSPGRKRRSRSRSTNVRGRRRSKSSDRNKRSKSRSVGRRKRSRSGDRSRRSRSRSPDRRRRSRSRGRGRRPPFRSRSFDRRDRWKREPSHSPVVILRKQRRSGSRTRRSASKTPPRLTDLDKDQLLEIAKANAAAMCAKAGVPIPESLRPKAILQLPLPTPSPSPISLPLPLPLPMGMGMPNMPNMGPMGLPSIPGMPTMSNITMSAAVASMTAATMTAALTNMGALAAMPPLAPLPTISNKPPPCLAPPTPSLNLDHIEEVKRKVTHQANIHTIKELTEKCKMISSSKEEMAVAKPHVSDDES
uniref:Si:dkey-67c22.2 n=1 Tax=Nothobranchius pienaari TaxID=704102 RepID=A0A1A8LF76_9TELE